MGREQRITHGSYHSLIQAFVHCRLDYCNSALAGVAKVYLQKLQSVQNMAVCMVSGVHRSEHITPVLEAVHWLPVSQRVVFKTRLDDLEVCSWCRSSLSQRLLRTRYFYLRSSAAAICSDWHSTGSTRSDCNWTTKFRSQRTSHMEPSATSTTVTGPVGERLQAGTETHLFSTARRH